MNVEEQRQVQFGRTRIDYGIRRSCRRATVAVAVDARHGVMLTAPTLTSAARLDAIVRDKAGWIVDRLRLIGQSEVRAERRAFISGESLAYLGRQHRLKVQPLDRPGDPKLERGWLIVPVPRELDVQARAGRVERVLRQWYRDRARAKLPGRVAYWAGRIGVDAPQVVVKDQQRRWGSYHQAGIVRLNWKIMQAPIGLVDYVVAHELVHVIHSDHSKAFWGRLGQAMPDYDRRKQQLRRLGPRLEW